MFLNEGGTSAEISFADVDTVMTSPIKGKDNGEVERLKRELLKREAENEGLLLKTTQLEETLAEYRQRFAGYQNQEEMRKTEPELLDYELYEAEDKNRELVALVRYIERGFGKGLLDADGKVLPEILKEAKDSAPVDTFDTE